MVTPTRTHTATPTTSPTVPIPTPTAPSATLPLWLRGPVVTRLPTTSRVIALTFDGGSGAQGAASVLATLKAAHVPATFFLTGDFARSFPKAVAAISAGRYLVGNHTMSHLHLTQLSSVTATDQINDAEDQLDAVLGGIRRPWFRFPFGEYDSRTLRLVHNLGYGAIGWTVDTLGWQGKQAGGVDDIVTRVHAALRPGAIVLMHLGANPDDGTTYDADALQAVIAMVRSAGYSFVDLRR
jgi:peptidoglycan/xylan/chitin deacetylase (PgdA/CDA1 family)